MNHNNDSTSLAEIDLVDFEVVDMPILDLAVTPAERRATTSPGVGIRDRAVLVDRPVRVRLLAGSAVGVVLLVLGLGLQPHGDSPFAGPSGPVAWIAAICGVVGVWLVPGLWLSAVMMQTGAGPTAWLTTRIGTTLAWYALPGPIVHDLAQGAQATTDVVFGVTVAATAAVCVGVLLGLLPRPVDRRMSVIVAALVGGICAQVTIALAMRLWTYDVNYDHIRRLDWLIVLACAFLAAVGSGSHPVLPVHGAGHLRKIVVALNVLTITAAFALTVSSRWSPEQRMPSAFTAEQVTAPIGADLALALTALGPDGDQMLHRASFAASDSANRPVRVGFRLVEEGATADPATLLIVLDPADRPVLCGSPDPAGAAAPVKLTVSDRTSGVLVQALIPQRWCHR
jgi:hypothetical protein